MISGVVVLVEVDELVEVETLSGDRLREIVARYTHFVDSRAVCQTDTAETSVANEHDRIGTLPQLMSLSLQTRSMISSGIVHL